MQAIVKKPQETPKVVNIEAGLKPLQKLVGGFIECVYDLEKYKINIWINDEGKLEELPPNLFIYDRQDFIAGTAIFIGVNNEGEDIALTEEQLKIVLNYIKLNSVNVPFYYHL